MKKSVYSILAVAAVLFAVSCQRETQTAPEKGGLVDVTFQVGLQGLQTKAFSDGTSATTLDVYVYSARTDGDVLLPALTQQKENAFQNLTAQVTMKLVRGENYKIVFFAHAPQSPYTVDPDNATLTVTSTVTNAPAPAANDELRDAFLGKFEGQVVAAVSENVSLKRPFAQLDVLTTDADWDAAIANGVTFAGSSMKVWAPSEMNLLTGEVSKEVAMEFAMAPITEAVNIPQYETGYKWIAMNYILASDTKALIGEANKPFSFAVYREGQADLLFEQTLVSVPVQRNYRTVMVGDVFCVDGNFNVSIVPDYDGVLTPGGNTDTAVDAVINADDVEVEVGKTVAIGATTNSTGTLTYETIFTDYISVDADGVVTGLKTGTVEVTIKVAAVEGKFKAAEKTIEVLVYAPPVAAIAIDGNFDEWTNVTAIAGTGAIKAMKVLFNDEKYFFYLEADKTKLNTDTSHDYANYFTLHFDDGDRTGNIVSYFWNQPGLDKIIQLWLMQQGVPNLITWDVDGFDHKEAVDGDVAKFEFCINRTAGSVFAGQHLLFAASVDGLYVDGNDWKGSSDIIGFAPASDQDMADVGPTPVTPATDTPVDVTITADNVEVEEGKTVKISYSLTPASTGAVTFTSNDKSIATVDADGVVTGVKAGTTTIGIEVDAVAGQYNLAFKSINVTVTAAATATGITIDGDMSDWANITGATATGSEINAAFKVTSDADNIYFYVKRTTERMSEIWEGNAYHYYCFVVDNNTENDVDLWGNGPYDMILVIYPYAGTSSAPAFGIAKAGATAPSTCSVENAVINGVVTTSGVETEISIPRTDLITIPTTEVTVYSWSNKGGSDKLSVTCTL